MTNLDANVIESLSEELAGQVVVRLFYVDEDDYFVLVLRDDSGRESEFSFRFMSDLYGRAP